jgi:hypothetical protein
VDQSGALFAVALNDREYMLKAAKQEDAEMWVAKLNVLKANPPGTPGSGAAPASPGGGQATQPPRSASGVRAGDLASATGGGQTDPNAWAKRGGRLGCC